MDEVLDELERTEWIEQGQLEIDSIVKLSLKKVYMKREAKMAIRLRDEQGTILELAMNQDQGLLMTDANNATHYLDLNPFNSLKMTQLLFFVIADRLFISIDGVTFNDIIYTQKTRRGSFEINSHYLSNLARVRFEKYVLSKEEKEFLTYQTTIYDGLIEQMVSQKNIYT